MWYWVGSCTGRSAEFHDLTTVATQFQPLLIKMAGENLDLTSGEQTAPPAKMGAAGRRFIGIRFDCCDVYTRVYVNRDETAYEGQCPKCFRPVHLSIGRGGTDCRFFTAY